MAVLWRLFGKIFDRPSLAPDASLTVARDRTPHEDRAGIAAGDPHDLAYSPEAVALQAAIAETPHDHGPQLVLADLLVAADDPRGELIVLHQRETSDGLKDPEALERYLYLGALYSFPRALPEEPVLPFDRLHAENPVRYQTRHHGSVYDIAYTGARLEVRIDGRIALERRLALASRASWTEEEATLLLRHLSDAIRAETSLQAIQLPFTKEPPLPVYGGGPVRNYRVPVEFTRRRGIAPYALGLAARDYHHWIAVWRRLARMLAQR